MTPLNDFHLLVIIKLMWEDVQGPNGREQSWKEWSGRESGSETYEDGDLLRGWVCAMVACQVHFARPARVKPLL